MASGGRRVAIVGAIGAVCALALAALLWREFAVAHYLRRLRSEPRFFETLLDVSEQSLAGAAMVRFVKDPDHLAILVEEFVRTLDTDFPEGRLVEGWHEAGFSLRGVTSRSSVLSRGERPAVYNRVRVDRLSRWIVFAHGIKGHLCSYPDVAFAVIIDDEIKRRATGQRVPKVAGLMVHLTRDVQPDQFWAEPESPESPVDAK